MNTKKNLLYNIFYQLLTMALPLVTTPYISRVLGAEGIGIYTYSYTIANYFILFAMLGINNYGNRSIASVRDNKEELSKTFWSIYLIQVIMSLIMLVLYILYMSMLVNNNEIIAWLQIIYLVSVLFDINWLFFGLEKFKLTVTRSIIVKVISVILIFVFVKEKQDLWIYALLMVASILVSQLLLWPFVKKFIFFSKIPLRSLFEHIYPLAILFVPVLSTSVYHSLDTILLGKITDMVQVGLYQNALKIILFPMALIYALGTVMLPKVSNLIAIGKSDRTKELLDKSVEYSLFLSFALAFGLAAISPEFVPIFLGNEFTATVNLVRYLTITIVFIAWSDIIRSQILIPQKKDKLFVVSVTIGAVMNLCLNLLLIGKFQAMGAVISTILTEIFVVIYQTVKVRKQLDIKLYLTKSLVFIFAGIMMYSLVRIIGDTFEPSIYKLVFEIVVGTAVYLTISLIYFTSTKNIVVINILKRIRKILTFRRKQLN